MTLTRTERPSFRTWLAGAPRWTAVPDLSEWLERGGMPLEVVREPDAVIHRIEVPGIDPDRDLRVELDDGCLVVTAERREEHHGDGDGDGPMRSEFHYGRSSRRVTVPSGTTPEDLSASYRDGILEVRVATTGTGPESHRIAVTRD